MGCRKIKVSWCKHPVNVPGVPVSRYEHETALQIFCADWLRKRYELTGEERYTRWHHSANERDGARAGLTAKLMGQAKGFPDLVHIGMRIALEFKVKGRKLSQEQVQWKNYLVSLGWRYEVVRTFEQLLTVI